MSKICKKEGCNNIVPKKFQTEDGKYHNCQRRSFCFKCSPHGKHNTKNLNKTLISEKNRACSTCGSDYIGKGLHCASCYFKHKQREKSKKVYDMIGYDCWICGYDKGLKAQSVLDFHHVYPEDKMFNLSTREFIGYSWDKVWAEMQKCVSICCRCHREIHCSLISKSEVEKNI